MAFVIRTQAMLDGVPMDGLICVAYAESRFSGVVPSVGSPVPDSSPPDGGPVASSVAFGGTGEAQLSVPDAASYFIGCYRAANPGLIAWEGPKMATPHTSLQTYPSSIQQALNRSQANSANSIAVASNGAILPQSTIHLSSVTGLPATGGIIYLPALSTFVVYGATSGNDLTGCTGGAGTLVTGQTVYGPAYQNGKARRFVSITAEYFTTAATGRVQQNTFYATIGGAFQALATVGVANDSAVPHDVFIPYMFVVDPLGYYMAVSVQSGAGGGNAPNSWIETDD